MRGFERRKLLLERLPVGRAQRARLVDHVRGERGHGAQVLHRQLRPRVHGERTKNYYKSSCQCTPRLDKWHKTL